MQQRSPLPPTNFDLLPENEAERLAALHRYQILDTPPEMAFDRITALAARLFQVPIALVSLVDESRAWFKSSYGFEPPEVARDATICSFALLFDEILVVPDARLDERFVCNPFVMREPGLRFYAGAPLLTRDGFNLGTLCLLDTQPRDSFTVDQQQILMDLAVIVVDEMELRFVMSQMAKQEADLREQNSRLELVQEATQSGCWDWDLVTNKAYVSPQYNQILGLSPDASEISYDQWLDKIHPTDRPSVDEQVTQALQQGQDYAVEYRVLHPEGIRWVDSRGRVYLNAENQPIRMLGNLQDITQRKAAEAERAGFLQREQAAKDEADLARQARDQAAQRAIEILNSTTDCFVALDAEWRITDVNRATIELNHRPAADFIGKTHWEVWPWSEGTIVEQRYREAIATGIPAEFEVLYEPLQLWLEIHAYPSRDGLNLFFRDISARQQAATEREQLLQREQSAREQAEKANRIKDEFLAVLSHELRTPLNPILGWIKLLQTGQLDTDKTQQAFSIIERNAELQTQLIDDLLDVSRILRGKLTLSSDPVNLATVIRAAIDTVKLAAEAKSITLQLQLDDAIGTVLGDTGRLQQITWNLLTNAIKFTPQGGRVEVRLSQVEDAGGKGGGEKGKGEGEKGKGEGEKGKGEDPGYSLRSFPGSSPSPHSPLPTPHSPLPTPHSPLPTPPTHAQIQVTDTGKGISPEFLPYVFERFQQADSSTTRQFGGLGLGLAIVRQLVELHGGTVQVESAGEGQGATFTVRLPLVQRSPIAERSPSCLLPQPSSLQGLQILIVDDEGDARELVQFIVEQEGAIATSVGSASEALEALQQSEFAVLISDIGMAEMDGYMLMEQIRAQETQTGRRLWAIALTAYAGEYNQQQAIKAGFQHHLSKPLDPEALITAIAQNTTQSIIQNIT